MKLKEVSRVLLLVALLVLLANSSKLLYMTNTFRHGARYTVYDIFDGKQTSALHGKLTTVGLRQQYLLGNYLRNDYITKMGFLNSSLVADQIQAYSDIRDVDNQRCLYSTMANLLGLYQFGSGYKLPAGISEDLLIPPFGQSSNENLQNKDLLETSQENNDNFALNLGFMPVAIRDSITHFPECPNHNAILSKRFTQTAKQIIQLQAQNAAFTEKMALIFNLSVAEANLEGLLQLYDVITCDRYLGRAIPSQFTQADYQQLKYIQNYMFALIYGEEPAKIFSTPYLQQVLNNFDNVILKYNNKTSLVIKKLSTFGVHDTDLVPLLTFLNLTTPECIKKVYKNQTVVGNCAAIPGFAGNLILEFHDLQNSQTPTQDSNFGVKIRYNGEYFKPCGLKQIICPYDIFKSLVKSNLVDFGKACKITNSSAQVKSSIAKIFTDKSNQIKIDKKDDLNNDRPSIQTKDSKYVKNKQHQKHYGSDKKPKRNNKQRKSFQKDNYRNYQTNYHSQRDSYRKYQRD